MASTKGIDESDSFRKRLLGTYLEMATSGIGLEFAAFLLIIGTVTTVALIPAASAIYVYQAVSGHIISLPMDQLRGATAGLVVFALVFWVLFGAAAGAVKAAFPRVSKDEDDAKPTEGSNDD